MAALSPNAAFGVVAIVAAVLHSLEGDRERHRWRPEGAAAAVLDASSFVRWLPASLRRWLSARSATWEFPAGDALRAVIAAIEGAG